jgi:hypothetical protein
MHIVEIELMHRMENKIYCCSYEDWLWAPSKLLFNRNKWFFTPGIKQLGDEADHTPPYSAKVKNEWTYTTTLPYIFMFMYRGSFTFSQFYVYGSVHR